MNPDQPSREEIEVKLTALLLGELPANEAKLLRWTIAHDAQLKQLHDRLKLTIGLVREVSAKTSAQATDHETVKTDDLKLSESRRGKLLAQLEKPSPQPLFWLKRIEMPRLPALLLPALAALAILGLLAAFVLPNFVKARSTSPANAIINNLRALDAAKQEWALEQHKPADATPTMEDLKPFLTKNGAKAVAGEKYVLGKVSESPVANLAGSLDNTRLSKAQPRQLRLDGNRAGGGGAGGGNVAMASAAPAAPREITVAPSPMLAPPPTRIVLPSAEPAHEAIVVTGSLNDQGNTWNVSGNLRGFYGDAHGPVAHGGVISYGLPSSLPPQSLPANSPGRLPSSFSSGVAMPPNPIAEMQPNAFADSGKKNTSLDKSTVSSAGVGGETMLGIEFRQIATNNSDLALNWPARDRTPAEKQPAQTTERFSTDNFFANKEDATKAAADSLATDDFMPTVQPPTQATAAATPVSGVDLSAQAPVAGRAFRPGTSSIAPHTGGDATGKEFVQRLQAIPPAASPAPNVSDTSISANDPAYQEAKRKLAQMQDLHKLLHSKIEQTSTDLALPLTSFVQITELAEPGKSETLMQKMTGTVESKVRLKVENEGADIASYKGASTTSMQYDPYFVQTTFEIMQSDVVLGKVVDDLKLDQAWAKSNGSKLDKKSTIALLKKRLQLQPVTNTKMIEIKATSDQPEEAANIADALAKAYQDYRQAARKQFLTNGIASLNEEFLREEQQIQEQQEKINQLEKKLKAEATNATDQVEPDAATRRPSANAPVPQPEILTRDNAFSTFSLNVSDVSFKLAAASLEKGQLPDPASIRSEEFINAFDYRDPEAAPGEPIAFATERARYPFAQNRDLLRFSLKTAAAGRPAGRALNLVLLLDNSGSMERADRVQIIRAALAVLTTQLQPQDTVSVVTFARTARLWLDGASGTNAGAALEKIGELTPQGGTNLEEAMRLAYETARRHYQAGGLNRVVMLTDGAANLGNVDATALTEKVEANRRQGIALDCFGIGWEGLNDDLLEQLTRHGDGRYAFINTPEEATQQFAAKLAGALQIAAADVKVQVEFNPQRVVSYRQIGYAKHQLTKEQFRDNTVDAAEIAAQEAGNALYTVETKPDGNGPVATVRVRYKVPGTTDYRERSWDVPYTGNAVALAQASPALRLAATASAFSEWLAASPFAQEISPAELTRFMAGVPEMYGADERPKQLVLMLLQAKSLAGK